VHSYQYTEERVENELGSKIAEVFSEFDEKPIASGSIAQVYRAVLNGETVAVKVRHPNVREHIVKDFIVMKWVADFAEKVLGMQWLNLSESLSQFSGTIASQTRLDVEGWHLYLFNRNFRKWRDVSFPRPIVVTESVLVESFEHGETVSKYAKIMPKAVRKAKDRMVRINGGTPSSSSPETFAEGSVARLELAHFIVCRGEDIYLKMLLEDNLMHADMHPGNILVAASEDVAKVSHSLVLVDAGMVAQLTRGERHNFIGLLSAVGEGGARGGKEAAKFILNFSPSSDYSEATRDAFAVDMNTYFDTSCGGYGAGTDLGEVLRGILGLCRKHQISVAANYATLIMNALCLDGMAGSLLPSYNILDGAKTFLRFHRFCANKGCSPLARYVVPAATRIKRITDRRFLKREKGQT
jgi:aarF domain-containing kinase